ncbi:hypothetical protein LKD70_06750 [Ruminococcus sp. CLA-AA-H200]|uniref:Transglutaminase-like domain-containing protein n=1 Tax=Ruminococcus turbiniformis TaxID=2881258 RepID=A0ABS8FVS6_9FIRM|nr:transglutaminase domain-containing protein [Ruminococcus turbiniformis]MCC2254140.1 hypothetical protein [Ruminococcus turbiniformis]
MRPGKKTALLLAGALAIQSPLTVLAEETYPEEQQATAEFGPEDADTADTAAGEDAEKEDQEPAGGAENGEAAEESSGEAPVDTPDAGDDTSDTDGGASDTGDDASDTGNDASDTGNDTETPPSTDLPDGEDPSEEIPDEGEPEEEPDVHKPGWYLANEGWYYYNSNGEKMTGWQWINGAWYYLNPSNTEYPGLMIDDSSYVINGTTYCFNSGGAMASGGWYFTDEGWYYLNGSGAAVTGWQWIGNVWYYLDPANAEYPGLMLSDETAEINGQRYLFKSNGAMYTGWYLSEDGWRYYGWSGAEAAGWISLDSVWYYLDPENDRLMVSNCEKEIGGKLYRFKENGAMYTGWYLENGTEWRYYRPDGDSATGWVLDRGKWYYFDPENENRMAADCEKVINGTNYIFTSSGAMYTGWHYVDGEGYYYYTESGFLASGWCQVGQTWYYMDPENNNIMVNDKWKDINGYRYSFYDWGGMRINWGYIDGYWYYFALDGSMHTGWQTIDGKRYYLYKKDDPNGGVWGAMATNVTIDGIYIAADGTASAAYGYAAAVLDQIGWDLRAAFNWSASLSYVSVSDTPDPGSEYFATYGFQNGSGDCYVMAATFYYMAKLLGYDAHQMTGYVPLLNGGMGPHSWVEIDMNGTTYVFDPDFTHETGYNGYQITYGASGTWIYRDYYRMN